MVLTTSMRFTYLPLAATVAGILAITVCEVFTPVDGIAHDPEGTVQVQEINRIKAERFRVVDQLLDRQVSLAQAAERFQQLAAEASDDQLIWLRNHFPNASCAAEFHFRHVVLYAEARGEQRGAYEPLLAELRKELEDRQLSDNWSLEAIPGSGS